MKKSTDKVLNLLQYGLPSDLANKIVASGLSITSLRANTKKILIDKFGLSDTEASLALNCTKRKPIDKDLTELLLSNSNYLCNICKGDKGKSYIIHHIVEYSSEQDNNYNNLIVLCPTDHDLAHREGICLTEKISREDLISAKTKWEKQVEKANMERASLQANINMEATDYVNVVRIEELVKHVFGTIPHTPYSHYLQQFKILKNDNSFNLKYVKSHLSNGRYLFDYSNHNEMQHYVELLKKLLKRLEFHNLEKWFSSRAIKNENPIGKHVFFVGGIYGRRPELPINDSTPPVVLHYKRGSYSVEWIVDPFYMYSMSAIHRLGQKNSYIIYGVIRNISQVSTENKKIWKFDVRPYLIAMPNVTVCRTPTIRFIKDYENYVDDHEVGFP